MFRKILPFAGVLALALITTAIAQERLAPEDIFLAAEKYKLRAEDAYKMVVAEVFKEGIGKREVYNSPGPVRAGTVIEDVMGHKFAAPATDSWVYFVDEAAGADWGHPAKLVYVDAMKGVVSVIECHFPPKMLPAFKGITKGAAEEISRIKGYEWWKEIKVPVQEKYPFKGPSKNKKYHVLISGGINSWMNNARYLNDLKFIYYTLQKRFTGNGDDNVYVIYADGVSVDLDGDGDNDVDYAATHANVVGVLTTLAANLKPDDILFVYVNNHGGTEGGKDCYICLYYAESIKDDEFAGLINKTQAGQMKFVFKQCFSGGMIDDLAALKDKNLVVATACNYDEFAWGATSPPGAGSDGYGEFTYWWTAAVYEGYPPSGFPGTHPTSPDPKTADVNGNKKVTMKEAFDFAKANDRQPEHPQYYASAEAANNWTLCKKPCGCCGATSKAEAATFFGLFFAAYAVILLRRKYKA